MLEFRSHYEGFVRIQISILAIFFLLRSFLLFHFCANVNCDARKPLKILRDASPGAWSVVEVNCYKLSKLKFIDLRKYIFLSFF